MSGNYSAYKTDAERKTAISEIARTPKRIYEIRAELACHQDIAERLVFEMVDAGTLTRHMVRPPFPSNNDDTFVVAS